MSNFSYSDELYHFGISGMKWGIRRFQNEDGSLTPEGKIRYGYGSSDTRRIIPKGTVVYRTSVNKKEGNTGHAYVSISQVDRNYYKGGDGSGWLKEIAGDRNAKLYEHKYKLKEDLKVASKEDIIEAMQGLSKKEKDIIDKASKKAFGNAGLSFYLQSGKAQNHYYDIYEKVVSAMEKKTGRNYDDLTVSELEDIDKSYKKLSEKHGKKVVDSIIKEYSKLSINDAYELGTARSLGTNDEARNIIIEKLKKKGFNAMIDQAGIGTSSKNQTIYGEKEKEQLIEGDSPTIIFDRSIMEPKGDHGIGEMESIRSSRDYYRWQYKKRSELEKQK